MFKQSKFLLYILIKITDLKACLNGGIVLSDIYVDLLEFKVDFSDLDVDLSGLYVDMSENDHHD